MKFIELLKPDKWTAAIFVVFFLITLGGFIEGVVLTDEFRSMPFQRLAVTILFPLLILSTLLPVYIDLAGINTFYGFLVASIYLYIVARIIVSIARYLNRSSSQKSSYYCRITHFNWFC